MRDFESSSDDDRHHSRRSESKNEPSKKPCTPPSSDSEIEPSKIASHNRSKKPRTPPSSDSDSEVEPRKQVRNDTRSRKPSTPPQSDSEVEPRKQVRTDTRSRKPRTPPQSDSEDEPPNLLRRSKVRAPKIVSVPISFEKRRNDDETDDDIPSNKKAPSKMDRSLMEEKKKKTRTFVLDMESLSVEVDMSRYGNGVIEGKEFSSDSPMSAARTIFNKIADPYQKKDRVDSFTLDFTIKETNKDKESKYSYRGKLERLEDPRSIVKGDKTFNCHYEKTIRSLRQQKRS
jgi:hypothetical protein